MTENNVQIYTVYIHAPAQKVWDAITQSQYTTRWGYGGAVDYDLSAGAEFRHLTTPAMREMGLGDVAISGTVVEVDPPRKLVLQWQPAWHQDKPATQVTWEITAYPDDVTKVVLTHDLSGAPELGAEFAGGSEPASGGGGWPWALSDLKSLLETGGAMAGDPA
ncbi:MAG: SRPBCC domain-containing protein [Cumulibacter sp.]